MTAVAAASASVRLSCSAPTANGTVAEYASSCGEKGGLSSSGASSGGGGVSAFRDASVGGASGSASSAAMSALSAGGERQTDSVYVARVPSCAVTVTLMVLRPTTSGATGLYAMAALLVALMASST